MGYWAGVIVIPHVHLKSIQLHFRLTVITPLGVSHLKLHPSWILYDDANYHSPVSNGVHPHDLWIFAIVI